MTYGSATVYGKPNCVWCDRAKRLLDESGIVYIYKDVVAPSVLAELKEQLPTVKTVPQIWLDDQYIGGYENLRDFLIPDQDFGQGSL